MYVCTVLHTIKVTPVYPVQCTGVHVKNSKTRLYGPTAGNNGD